MLKPSPFCLWKNYLPVHLIIFKQLKNPRALGKKLIAMFHLIQFNLLSTRNSFKSFYFSRTLNWNIGIWRMRRRGWRCLGWCSWRTVVQRRKVTPRLVRRNATRRPLQFSAFQHLNKFSAFTCNSHLPYFSFDFPLNRENTTSNNNLLDEQHCQQFLERPRWQHVALSSSQLY